jgi:DNA-binding NarL/FixJ family response regulator
MPVETPHPQTARPARVLIVDDHELARSGLRMMLSGTKDISIVGEAINGREAVDLCRELRPDVVMMDVRMPQMDGLTATEALKRECPTTSVIMVTMHEDADYLLRALQAGAAGYLLKDATQQDVIKAVRQVLSGESILSPEMMSHLLRRLAARPVTPSTPQLERLTPRELDVLRLLVDGQTNREIAYNLGISVGTVKAHVEHIIAKLGASDRTQAAVRAVELRLLSS